MSDLQIYFPEEKGVVGMVTDRFYVDDASLLFLEGLIVGFIISLQF